MKYLKRFESDGIDLEQEDFKVGDYVKRKVYTYKSDFPNFYIITDINEEHPSRFRITITNYLHKNYTMYDSKTDIIKLTPEEIEIEKLKINVKKYNL